MWDNFLKPEIKVGLCQNLQHSQNKFEYRLCQKTTALICMSISREESLSWTVKMFFCYSHSTTGWMVPRKTCWTCSLYTPQKKFRYLCLITHITIRFFLDNFLLNFFQLFLLLEICVCLQFFVRFSSAFYCITFKTVKEVMLKCSMWKHIKWLSLGSKVLCSHQSNLKMFSKSNYGNIMSVSTIKELCKCWYLKCLSYQSCVCSII